MMLLLTRRRGPGANTVSAGARSASLPSSLQTSLIAMYHEFQPHLIALGLGGIDHNRHNCTAAPSCFSSLKTWECGGSACCYCTPTTNGRMHLGCSLPMPNEVRPPVWGLRSARLPPHSVPREVRQSMWGTRLPCTSFRLKKSTKSEMTQMCMECVCVCA